MGKTYLASLKLAKRLASSQDDDHITFFIRGSRTKPNHFPLVLGGGLDPRHTFFFTSFCCYLWMCHYKSFFGWPKGVAATLFRPIKLHSLKIVPNTVDGFWNPESTSWYGSLSHYVYQVLYIPGGCLGFINHQQYHPKKCETTLVFFNAGNPNDKMLGPWTPLTTCLKAEEAPFRKQTNKYTRQLMKHHSNLLIQQLIIFLFNVFVTLLLHLEEIFNVLKQNNWSQESVVSHKTPTTVIMAQQRSVKPGAVCQQFDDFLRQRRLGFCFLCGEVSLGLWRLKKGVYHIVSHREMWSQWSAE